MGELDFGILIQWFGVAILVGGGIYLGRRGEAKRIAKEVNEENMKLADTRGKKIDDLQEELAQVRAEVAQLSLEIQVLKDERLERIVEGVVVGLRPFLQHD